MPQLSPVVEIKRTLAGGEKRFDCKLLASDERHAAILWIGAAVMHVHGVDLPSGTVSFGHFWTNRNYNVYHWLDGEGGTLGYYFNIADETRFSPGEISWRDLAVDVLVTPAGRFEVLDEHELPADLDPALMARVESGRRAILDHRAEVLAEVEVASRAVAHLVFPHAA